MSDREAVFRQLVRQTDAEPGETTTVTALAAEVDTAPEAVRSHVDGLVEMGLARREGERVRISGAGAELFELDLDGPVVVDPVDSE